MINRLSGSLSAEQLDNVVGKLNRGDPNEILANEWEVCILSAFRAIGRIQYEPNFGGTRTPDLFFKMGESGNFEFLAEITTVSDAYAHKENADREFCDNIRSYLNKRGHNGAGINIDVAHQMIGKYRDSRVKLLLPPKGQIHEFVKTELGPFLSQIAKEPDKDAAFSYGQDKIRFSIQYNSNEKRFSGGHSIVYTVPYSGRRNPLTNALENKWDQLAKSGYSGPRGIIVCDGGCETLRERNAVSGMHGCSEIVEPFLKAHNSLLFILVMRVEEHYSASHLNRSIQIHPKLYWNSATGKNLYQQTKDVIDRMLHYLPKLESTPTNALSWLAAKKTYGRPIGEITVQGNTIKISARALTELLAGKTGLKEFLEDHHFKPTERGGFVDPFFERQLAMGNTLKNSYVEPNEHKDDDRIVLEYDGPDPAISPFRMSQ